MVLQGFNAGETEFDYVVLFVATSENRHLLRNLKEAEQALKQMPTSAPAFLHMKLTRV